MKIKEIIVVEGKDDTVAIRRAVDADTIETNGSAISEETIEKIKFAQETRGVIVFTDPDYPGEKIRKTIMEHVVECKHAFLPKEEAISKGRRGIGVEHASPEAIRKALKHAHFMMDDPKEEISKEELLAAGLIGRADSKARREKLGQLLRIGYANGKQLYKRLKMFQISKKEFSTAIEAIDREEKNE